MTAVRWLGRAAACVVLLLVVVAAVLWAWAGPQGWPLAVWLLGVCLVVVGAGLCVSAGKPKGDGDGG